MQHAEISVTFSFPSLFSFQNLHIRSAISFNSNSLFILFQDVSILIHFENFNNDNFNNSFYMYVDTKVIFFMLR